MTEISPIILSDSKVIPDLSKNVLSALVIVLIWTLIWWYAQYHWKRRKLYQMAAQTNGPLTLPFIGNALYFAGSSSHFLDKGVRLAKDFDSPVRIWFGQKLFFLIWEPNDLETILNSPHALNKEAFYKHVEPAFSTGLLTASVPKWKRHRKIIMPTFNQKILDEFVEVFSEQSQILLEQLKKEVGKGTFNIFQYVSRCTLDILCETVMGITVNAQTTDLEYIKWANKAMEIVIIRILTIWYHPDFIFNRTSMSKELYEVENKMHAFTRAVVTEKRSAYQTKLKENRNRSETVFGEEPRKRNSFLQQLIELSEEGDKFTDEELREEVDTFMVAGSDSTASMNSYIFIMLGMFPDIQDKVYEEVINVLGPNRPVECEDFGKLQYLERVIKETLRLFPLAPVITRAVTEDIKLENCTVPAGSSVGMSMLILHRDPNIWPLPLKFDPDRFLPENVAKRHPYSWLPFSGGPRNCIGPKYAMMSMKALIATVIRKYRFFTNYKSIEDVRLKAELVLKPVDGYTGSIELRG